jgi:hypothetical protein
MSETNIVRMSEEEVRKRVADGEDRTDYERLRGLTDEEIEEAVRSDPDAPPLLDEDWFEKAEFVPGLGQRESPEREERAEAEGMRELVNTSRVTPRALTRALT